MLSVRDVSVHFPMPGGFSALAVRGVSLDVAPGETMALIGESGSGKSVLGLSILSLLPPEARVQGAISFEGQNLLDLDEPGWSNLRGPGLAFVPQSAGLSLNPTMVVSSQVAEAFRPNGANGLRDRAADLLARFGLGRREAQAYPHQLSGGMRQRVLVAMGLAPEPRLMIADEPTKGIDHQRVREVERLFHRLKEQNPEMALLIVTHDLDFARTMADRVAVMYAGRLVEIGLKDRFFIHPLHPYSRALLEAAPSGGLKPIRGQAPGVDEEFPGCPFAPRCDLALPGCLDSFPPTAGQSGEMVYCWRHAWSGSRQ